MRHPTRRSCVAAAQVVMRPHPLLPLLAWCLPGQAWATSARCARVVCQRMSTCTCTAASQRGSRALGERPLGRAHGTDMSTSTRAPVASTAASAHTCTAALRALGARPFERAQRINLSTSAQDTCCQHCSVSAHMHVSWQCLQATSPEGRPVCCCISSLLSAHRPCPSPSQVCHWRSCVAAAQVVRRLRPLLPMPVWCLPGLHRSR